MKRNIPPSIYIMDLDYMAKGEPNFLGMRIASFHKQMGDYVVLMEAREKIPKEFKKMYVLRRDTHLEKPPITLLYNQKVCVHGIEFFNNWTPPATMLACRPDYGLYPRGRDKFERADAVQLTDECGNLLHLRQDDENVETNKDTVITDEKLWELSDNNLLEALNSIKDRKNIYFLSPIPLTRIVHNELIKQAFLQLKFAQKVELQWINAFPFKRPQVDDVLKFFDQFKAWHGHNKIGAVSFYPKPRYTTDRENILLGIEFILALKQRQMQIKLEPLHSRLESPYAHAYELLRAWSEVPRLSWMEIIAGRGAAQLKITVEQYYCHEEWWYDELFRAGIDLMLVLGPELESVNKDWMLWQYKDKYYARTNVDWSKFRSKTLWY